MNTQIGKLFFFKPVQDFESLAPTLILLSIAIGVISVFAWAAYLVHAAGRRKKEKAQFHQLARRYNLNDREETFLRRMARTSAIRPLHRILSEQDKFERAVKRLRGWSRADRQHFLEMIRQKLYARTLRSLVKINSTYDLIPGSRLLLQHTGNATELAWAHLVDSEDEGLIVVVAQNEGARTPLRPKTLLDVTAYIPKHDPVRFHSQVLKVVPGPSRMLVLEHSRFIKQTPNPFSAPKRKEASPRAAAVANGGIA
ncbi:MAG: flagellar brake protein [Candidatus Hinthialibacter antarcticus]|nr:flagellar brake protein [Candidatus Hinthialibacter antarcticus]